MKKHNIEYVEVVGVDGGGLLLFVSLCITKCSEAALQWGKEKYQKIDD